MAGCGSDGASSNVQGSTATTSSTAAALPTAAKVEVAPQPLTQAVLPAETADSANALLVGEARPSLQVIPQAFDQLPQGGPVLMKSEDGGAKVANAEGRATPNVGLSPTGFTPAQIWIAYGLDYVYDTQGAGQTIAIVDAYGSPTIQNDLSSFCGVTGLPLPALSVVTPYGVTKSDAGWGLETSLDVEWAAAIAPKANILLVVARSSSLTDLANAVQYASSHGASVISMSWGSSEFSSESSGDYLFNVANKTFVASSGDTGAGVNWPAVSPYVTGVGGTTLKINSNNQVTSETGWSGSAGGRSTYVRVPAYQSASATTAGVANGQRAVPDVSYNGDPASGFMVYDSTPYQGQQYWFQVGGTSAGAPQWAGLIARANASRVARGLTPMTGASSLYGFNKTSFSDILTGSNGAYSAAAGYDLVTGLGRPLCLALSQAFGAAP